MRNREEIVRGFDWLINAGKAFYWGTSEWSAQQLQEAHEVAAKLNLIPPTCEQPHVSCSILCEAAKQTAGDAALMLECVSSVVLNDAPRPIRSRV